MEPTACEKNKAIEKQSRWVVSAFGVHPWNAPEFHGKREALDPLIDDSPMVGEITALIRSAQMSCTVRPLWLCLLLAGCITLPTAGQQWKAPTSMRKLANGFTVVVSEDHSAPAFGLCISYGIGFRLEPEGRTGFAHLFEHMMFEGTSSAPKGVLDRVIEGGGVTNGDTRYDHTEYIETAPISALDPVLWIEADRLKTLDFSPNLENQLSVRIHQRFGESDSFGRVP
jgi:hypothetical protein